LDYLGVPFRCSCCRQTGHVKKDCRLPFGVYSDEPHSDETISNGYSQEVETLERVNYLGARDLDCSPSTTTTFVGKLRHYIPSLYCSLSAWERDHLDSFFPAITNETGVPEKFELRDNESGGNLIPTESGDSPQVSKGVECPNYPPLDESPHKTISDQPLVCCQKTLLCFRVMGSLL
jgi:hypothetical protein